MIETYEASQKGQEAADDIVLMVELLLVTKTQNLLVFPLRLQWWWRCNFICSSWRWSVCSFHIHWFADSSLPCCSKQEADVSLLINVFSEQHGCNNVRTQRHHLSNTFIGCFLLGVVKSLLVAVIGFGRPGLKLRQEVTLMNDPLFSSARMFSSSSQN